MLSPSDQDLPNIHFHRILFHLIGPTVSRVYPRSIIGARPLPPHPNSPSRLMRVSSLGPRQTHQFPVNLYSLLSHARSIAFSEIIALSFNTFAIPSILLTLVSLGFLPLTSAHPMFHPSQFIISPYVFDSPQNSHIYSSRQLSCQTRSEIVHSLFNFVALF